MPERRAALAAVLLLVASVGHADASGAGLAEVFRAHGVTATFVAESMDSGLTHVYGEARAGQRFSPASTFKIPNTLIALDASIADVDATEFEWDGEDRGVAAWNRNQDLESAFRVSCVWCYRELARRVGRQRYEAVLADIGYGNARIGEQADYFWLDDSLAISAREQVDFLRRMVNRSLPFDDAALDAVESFMLESRTDDYALYGKTGWAMTSPPVAWYVGFVRTRGGTWLFAMNLEPVSDEQAMLRKQLSIEALRTLGIIH